VEFMNFLIFLRIEEGGKKIKWEWFYTQATLHDNRGTTSR